MDTKHTGSPLSETEDKTAYTFLCPHCDGPIEVLKNQVNCSIFRHACYYRIRTDLTVVDGRYQIEILQQISPHLPKDQCDKLVEENKVVGCARPFRLVFTPDGRGTAEICDYI